MGYRNTSARRFSKYEDEKSRLSCAFRVENQMVSWDLYSDYRGCLGFFIIEPLAKPQEMASWQ